MPIRFAILVMTLGGAVEALRGADPPPGTHDEKVRWATDLTDALDPTEYQLKGIAWERGRLTFPQGSSLARAVEGGFSGELTLQMDFPPLQKEGEQGETRVGFQLSLDHTVWVVWQRQHDGQRETATLKLIVERPGGLFDFFAANRADRRELRRFPLEGPLSGRWRFKYLQGLLYAFQDEHERGIAFADTMAASIEALRIEQPSGQAFVRGLAFEAARRRPVNIAEDQIAAVGEETQKAVLTGYTLAADGKHREALPHLHKAQRLIEDAVGPDDPTAALFLSGLARVYAMLDEHVTARRYLQRVVQIHEKHLGPDHPELASALDQITELSSRIWDVAAAYEACDRAVRIRVRVLGPDHPDLVPSLVNLGHVVQTLGRPQEAKQIMERALALSEKQHGRGTFGTVAALAGLSSVLTALGEHERAVELSRQTLALTSQTLGPTNPNALAARFTLGIALAAKGDYLAAIAEHERALAAYRQNYPTDDRVVANMLREKGLSHFRLREFEQARADLSRSLELNLQLAGDRLAGLAETEVLAHTKLIDLLCHMLLGVHRELPDLPPAEAYTPLWRTRALGTRALAQRHSAKNDSPEATQLRAEMEQIQRQLSALVLAPPQPGFGAVRSRKLAELSRRKEELQRKLLEMSAGFRREQSLDQASWTDLAAVLPPDTAIVDVIMAIMTRPGEDPFKIDPDFEAFVLRRADEPPGYRLTWVHLGKARPIQDAIENWREQIALEYEPRRFSERFCKPLDPDDGREGTLRALVWEKLEPHLAGCRTVVVLPDGGLARLPWAALPGKKPGTFLIDEYAIATAAYGQQVLDLLTRAAPADGPPLLVGGVVHGAPGGETHAGPKPPDPKPAAAEPQALFQRGTGLAWEDLKGARAEVEMIARLWPREARPKLISGRGADEDTLRRELPGARYIHLATHGFFADDAFRARRRHDTAGESLVPAGAALAPRLSITGRNPLVLSGLVLARANLPPEVDENGLPTGRDGLLTGEEVVSLDLRKAELVVLSACDSGLGDERLGEGVFGLQRAFSLAGARASIATLWAAEDAAARSLMAEFYTQLWTKGAGKLEALRAAQLAMIYGYDPTTQRLVPRGAGGVDTLPNLRQGTILPPFYWASFVLHGDWR